MGNLHTTTVRAFTSAEIDFRSVRSPCPKMPRKPGQKENGSKALKIRSMAEEDRGMWLGNEYMKLTCFLSGITWIAMGNDQNNWSTFNFTAGKGFFQFFYPGAGYLRKTHVQHLELLECDKFFQPNVGYFGIGKIQMP